MTNLRSLCIGVVAEHFDRIESAEYLDPDVYAAILMHPLCQASPRTVLQLEERHPEFVTQSTDEYWRGQPECREAYSNGIMPYPELVTSFSNLKGAIDAGATLVCDTPTLMTMEVLAETKIGKSLAKAVKKKTYPVAAALLARWRVIATDSAEIKFKFRYSAT